MILLSRDAMQSNFEMSLLAPDLAGFIFYRLKTIGFKICVNISVDFASRAALSLGSTQQLMDK